MRQWNPKRHQGAEAGEAARKRYINVDVPRSTEISTAPHTGYMVIATQIGYQIKLMCALHMQRNT